MDYIYSRKRIKLPKININLKNDGKKSKNNLKTIKFIIIIIVAFFFIIIVLNSIEPILNSECIIKAKSIATKISNEQATIVIKNYKYEDLCTVDRDESENIKMIRLNVFPVNEIISDVAIKVQNELNKIDSEDIDIRLGSFTGSKFLAGRGPKVKFKISTIGNVETDLKSKFETAGINQTLHKIYLQVKCKVVILTPFNQVEEEITNQILIAEAVILGNVPSSYYNFAK